MGISYHSIHAAKHISFADRVLASLELQANLDSGYYIVTTPSRFPGCVHPRLHVRYLLPNEPKRVPITLSVEIDDEREELGHFPYIDAAQHLRVWDVDKGQPLRVIGKGCVDGAMPPIEVRKRSSKLFAFAQKLGYWADIE